MDVNSGSWLFREEPLEVIKAIFRRALGAETVREARLLDGGLFNTTYLVTNGPGEASAADVGIAGGQGEGLLFRKGEIVKKVPQEQLVDELFALIDQL